MNDIQVLLVDSDSQGNATSGLGIQKDADLKTIYNVLVDNVPVSECIRHTDIEGLHILPADKNLIGVNLELVGIEHRESLLKQKLAEVKDLYSYILIDCPPALDLLTLNALMASDAILVPIQCEFFALEGVSELMDTVDRVRESFGHPLQIEGILLTMYDERTNLTRQVAADLREFFGTDVFKAVVPRNVRLAEAPSHGRPIISYDPGSKGAEAYIQLAKEVLANDQKRSAKGTR